MNKEGYVINIQPYSLHDGPGIRTSVFLKGCPLRCKWCSNPESQKSKPELAFNISKCIGIKECSRCIDSCKYEAIKISTNNEIGIERDLCKECHNCLSSCPSNALSSYGNLISVCEVLKVVERENVFYERSGGGMTLSGGEPLFQADFAIELLAEAKKRRIDTAMETCGYTEWGNLERACKFLNTIIFDIKCIDEDKHKKFTKVSNKNILSNFIKLCDKFPGLPKLVRTPIIPGFNDNEEDILEIVNFIKEKSNVKYELLTYHRLGQPKYSYLGREYPMEKSILDDEKISYLKSIAKIDQ